jgi:hypothetical protein
MGLWDRRLRFFGSLRRILVNFSRFKLRGLLAIAKQNLRSPLGHWCGLLVKNAEVHGPSLCTF